jgi:hypothetical protein
MIASSSAPQRPSSHIASAAREKKALLRVLEAPTSAGTPEGVPVYDFAFQEGLTERIVDDVLQAFPHMAVTPALQLVCASLYERLTVTHRIITQADYNKLGRINGIFGAYLERGISTTEPRTRAQVDQWHLPRSLVSRQGALPVSLDRTLRNLRGRRDLGLHGAIDRIWSG